MKITNILTGLALASALMSCGGEKKVEEKTPDTAPQVEEQASNTAEQISYTIDSEKSTVEWRGFKLAGLGEHVGDISIKSGSVTTEGDAITGGEVVIDMKTINNTDLDDAEYKAKLEGHLSNADFFDVENHETAKFVVTSIADGKVNGDLTVRGITVSASADLKSSSVTDTSVQLEAFLVFDRQKHEVSYKNTMGDAVISDDIEITIKLVANK